MSGREEQRRFSREYKLAALARMAAGENVSALSRERGVARKCLYQWQDRFRIGGAVALRSRGRMTKAEVQEMRGARRAVGSAEAPRTPRPPQPPPVPPDEMAQARERILELERKVAQQALDLDFFRQALRSVEEAAPLKGVPGGTRSTRSSRR